MCIACSTDELLSDSVGHPTSDSVRQLNIEGIEVELPIIALDTQNGFVISFDSLFIFSVTTNIDSVTEKQKRIEEATAKWKWMPLHSRSLETNIIREMYEHEKYQKDKNHGKETID